MYVVLYASETDLCDISKNKDYFLEHRIALSYCLRAEGVRLIVSSACTSLPTLIKALKEKFVIVERFGVRRISRVAYEEYLKASDVSVLTVTSVCRGAPFRDFVRKHPELVSSKTRKLYNDVL